MSRTGALALLLGAASSLPGFAPAALAQTAEPPSGGLEVQDEEAPPPPVVLRAIPPRHSWDFAFQASVGKVPLHPFDPVFLGLGLRGGWGRHFGKHRLGVAFDVTMEGPVTVKWSHAFEPGFSWEYVHPKGLYVGATVGPTVVVGIDLGLSHKYEVNAAIGPMGAVRLGFSQPYSLIARRFFVAVEPKVRWLNGEVNWLVAVVLGSGRGY